MNNIDKSIKRFENIVNKASMPLAMLIASFLIGRTLVSFIFGI